LSENRKFLWAIIFLAAIVAASLTFTINEANKCADKGGVYITGKGIWPVCLKAETL